MRRPYSVGVDGVYEVLEEVFSLERAGSDHCKESSGEEFPLLRLIAETDLSPLNGRSYALSDNRP
jgi:hypothetical protein